MPEKMSISKKSLSQCLVYFFVKKLYGQIVFSEDITKNRILNSEIWLAENAEGKSKKREIIWMLSGWFKMFHSAVSSTRLRVL